MNQAKEKLMWSRIWLVLLLILLASSRPAADNLLMNADGSKGEAVGWRTIQGNFAVSRDNNSWNYWHGGAARRSVMEQDVAIGKILPNQVASLQMQLRGGGSFATIEVEIESYNGVDKRLTRQTTGPVLTNQWRSYRLQLPLAMDTKLLRVRIIAEAHQSRDNDAAVAGLNLTIIVATTQKPIKIILGPVLAYPAGDTMYLWWHIDRSCPKHLVEVGRTKNLPKKFVLTGWTQYPLCPITGLESGARYYYRVRSGTTSSAIFSFTIPKADNFRLAMWGDNQNGRETFHRYTVPTLLSAKPNVLLAAGDLVDKGNRYSDWCRQLYQPAQPLLCSVPWFPVRGNHDGEYYLTDQMLPGPTGKSYYAYSYGILRVVVLDSNLDYTPRSPQLKWLHQEVKSLAWQKAGYRLVSFHHPPFTAMWDGLYHDGEVLGRSVLVPLLEKVRADVVICGHAHSYQRGCRVTPYGKTYYLVIGGGGGDLDMVKVWQWSHLAVVKSCFHIVTADVSSEQIRFRTIATLTRKVIDTFTIQAQSQRP